MIRCGPIITAAHRAPSGKLRRELERAESDDNLFYYPSRCMAPKLSQHADYFGALFLLYFLFHLLTLAFRSSVGSWW